MKPPKPTGDPLADFIAKAQAKKGVTAIGTPEPELLDHWVFSKDAPMFPDDGKIYRKQLLAPMYKRSRTVEVDEFDHDEIIKVKL